jgi:hypothetical protein
VKAMKNLLDVTGDHIPALPHTKKADIAARNQTQCSQRILARDTFRERDLLHQAQGAFQRVHPFPRDPAPPDDEDKVH